MVQFEIWVVGNVTGLPENLESLKISEFDNLGKKNLEIKKLKEKYEIMNKIH